MSLFRVSGLVATCVCVLTNHTLTYIIVLQVIKSVFISEIDKL